MEKRKGRINPISSHHQITTPAINLKKRGINYRSRKQRTDKKQEGIAPHLQANIDAKVNIRRSDIPAGIQTLLAVMGENIQIEEKKKLKEEKTA